MTSCSGINRPLYRAPSTQNPVDSIYTAWYVCDCLLNRLQTGLLSLYWKTKLKVGATDSRICQLELLQIQAPRCC